MRSAQLVALCLLAFLPCEFTWARASERVAVVFEREPGGGALP